MHRYLITGVAMRISLQRNVDTFSLLAASNTPELKINLKSLKLQYRTVRIKSALLQKQAIELEKRPAIYPLISSKIVLSSVSSGFSKVEVPNLINGAILPQTVCVILQ